MPDMWRSPVPELADDISRQRLWGRRAECAVLDELIAGLRAGHSRALVLRGPAGIGKTALLEYAAGRASRCLVVRVTGVRAEAGLAFAALHQLCAPFLDRLECLPGPQRDALGAAFGLNAGRSPDRLVIGVAVLTLLCEAAGERPLVCVVDDAQWLDAASRQVLAFVARRLPAKPVAVLVAVRPPDDLAGLPALAVDGLADADARAVLASVVPGPIDEQVRDRIVAETRGSPLALLQLPGAAAAVRLAGGFGLPDAVALPAEPFQGRLVGLAGLAPAVRLLLVVAAAEPVGDPVVVWAAAGRLGVEATAAAAATGLVELRGQVRFCDPFDRITVYRSAAPEERQRVHRALAEATDPVLDPDRRAWHRAHAVPGLDEAVARDLERSVDRARERGGLAAVAAFLTRAAELTPDPRARARRALAAARANHHAGAPDATVRLLAMARPRSLSELDRALVRLLRGRLATGDDGPPLLLEAAGSLEPLHPELAREAYRDGLSAALTAGRLATRTGVPEVAKAIRAASPGAHDPLLDGLAALTLDGHEVAVPVLGRALSGLRTRELSPEEATGWLPLACRTARELWDDRSWAAMSARLIGTARDAGALPALSAALHDGVAVRLLAGEGAAADSMVREAATVAGRHLAVPYGPLVIAAWRGREVEVDRLVAAATPELVARGQGHWVTATHWATAVLYNGLGRYDEALAAAARGCEYPAELGFATWSLVELVEAAARTGQAGRARNALRRLAACTGPSGTDWALGIEARSAALLSGGKVAERRFEEAIARLGRTKMRVELARAHLVYGEWLRRENRRVDARERLRTAYRMLTALGIEAYAQRARRELLATGETPRKRTVEAAGELTSQEAHIARLAGDGLSNPQISTRLYLSPRTVEWHLRKVFTKLGISSRRELRTSFPAALPAAFPGAFPAAGAGGALAGHPSDAGTICWPPSMS